eukprot:SM000134S26973  [mRNA]  locus=s134:359934:360852:- [translate_table: standard]
MQQPSGGGGGMFAGIGSTIAQGLAFGTGSAVAHRAVDSVMGPRSVVHEHSAVPEAARPAPDSPYAYTAVSADSCVNQAKAFQDCISFNNEEIGKCQFYLDMLKQCRGEASASPTMAL